MSNEEVVDEVVAVVATEVDVGAEVVAAADVADCEEEETAELVAGDADVLLVVDAWIAVDEATEVVTKPVLD